MQFLSPIILRPGYWTPVEKEINRIFAELIYKPMLRVLNQPNPELHNAAPGPLVSAISEGTVWYEDAQFHGHFNSAITRDLIALGASYNKKAKTWSLPLNRIGPQISMAQAHADNRYDALRRGLLTTLADINVDSIMEYQRTEQVYGEAIEWMDDDFKRSVRAITIPPKLTDTQRSIIAKDWGQNLNKYIKDWVDENILNLREQIQEGVMGGARPASFEKMIIANYGVSKNKARFLARQETSLLMSKFHETRYHEVGIDEYRWSTAKDERVRTDHKHLDKKIFRFDSPPVTNEKTGARNNPGEDFGCRCIAIPIVR